MSSLVKEYFTPEQYLALERKAEYKSEYINGQIYAMSGASREHNLIAINLSSELHTQLKGRPCEVYGSDMRVKVGSTRMYTYPDVTVVCGEPRFEDNQFDTLLNPNVIIEVLSPSTEAYDRGAKFAHYSQLESLVDHVLVAQDKVQLEHYVRQDKTGDQWVLNIIRSLDSTLRLASIDCEAPLHDIYNRIEFHNEDAQPEQS